MANDYLALYRPAVAGASREPARTRGRVGRRHPIDRNQRQRCETECRLKPRHGRRRRLLRRAGGSFYIPATGPTRLRRTLKYGDSFAVLDSHGDIGATRRRRPTACSIPTPAISRASSCCSTARPPLLLGSSVRDDNSVLTVDLTNPDIYVGKHAGAGEGHAARRPHHLSVARRRLPALGHPQLRRSSGQICGCRSSSTTISPICSRCAACDARGAAVAWRAASTSQDGAC